MESHKAFMQALVNGETLVRNGNFIMLGKDGQLVDEQGWLVPEGVLFNYEGYKIYNSGTIGNHNLFDPATDVTPLVPINLVQPQIEEFEEDYLTTDDSKLRTVLDTIARWVDKAKGIK